MSGLAAVFHPDGRPADIATVRSMLAAIHYLGRDGLWAEAFSCAALGYAKTAVTLEEVDEKQPLASPRTGCVVVADIRLDNRDQLRNELGWRIPSTVGDAELVLRAYERWDTDAPRHLLGDYAFVIWDPRRHRLVAARDTNGGRSLFYRHDKSSFAAASEIHQLLQDPSVQIAPNEQRIRDWLVPWRAYCNDQEQDTTFFDGVYLLPAGQILVVEQDRHQLQHYWQMPDVRELHYRQTHQYVQHFADVFVEAVKARLRSVHPIAAAMSGGLDSTSIVSVAHVLYQRGIAEQHGFMTYSMLFEEPECDESVYICDVQAMYGFDARGYYPTGLVSNFDPDPGAFLASPMKAPGELDPILGMAAEAGARTLMTGHYGDNCFGTSNRSFSSLLRRGRWGELLRQMHAYRKMSGDSLRRTLGVHCVFPFLPVLLQQELRARVAKRDFQRTRASLVPQWIERSLADELLAHDLEERLHAERIRRFGDDEREQIFTSLYPPENLPASGGSPVQIVRPFADRRLHEFMLAVPPEHLYQPHPYASGFDPSSKLILRRAMLGIIPERVRARTTKTHFSALVLADVQRRWSDFAHAFGPAGRSEVARRGYVDRERFFQRLERMRSGDFGPDGLLVIRILNLETWLRTFKLPRGQQTTAQVLGSHIVEGNLDVLMAPRSPGNVAPKSHGALVGAG